MHTFLEDLHVSPRRQAWACAKCCRQTHNRADQRMILIPEPANKPNGMRNRLRDANDQAATQQGPSGNGVIEVKAQHSESDGRMMSPKNCRQSRSLQPHSPMFSQLHS